MKIVTWNMGCGPRQSMYRKHHDEAWDYLLHDLRPEVALIQEALMQKVLDAEAEHTIAVVDVASGVDAATAVLVRKPLEARPIDALLDIAPSYIAAASVLLSTGSFVVASIHVYTDDSYKDALRAISAKLGPALDDRPGVIGGDFNAARRYDEVHRKKTCGWFFVAMEEAGFHDAHWNLHGKEVQTFWGRQAKEKYQDDHFFVSRAWSSRARSCEVVDNEIVRRVSDHGPVVLELDVG